MKKFLSILFATMLAGQAWAADNYDFSAECSSGQTLYYIITSDSTVELTYPNRIDNNYYYNYTKPTGAIEIPNAITYSEAEYAVTSIGEEAFRDCRDLTSVTIPESVTSIGYAFVNCSSLKSVAIPNSVREIDNAFYGCSNLIYNEYDNAYYLGNAENPYLCLIKTKSSEITKCAINDNCKFICGNAFYGCSGLTSVTIPESVTSIGIYAFCNCIGLTSVTIGNSVTSIGIYAFYGCSGLASVTIGNSVTSIGNGAFYECSGLASVTIGNSVTSIGSGAFYGCNNIDYAVYDNGYYIGNEENPYLVLFEAKNKSITSCDINNNCKFICGNAFSGCSGLTSLTIPESVTSIGDNAFQYCSGLASVTIPELVTSIGSNAFYGCIGLTSVTIPELVTSIGSDAFSGCSGLTSVTIGNSVTSIGERAFSGCRGLTLVTIPNSVTSIGNGAFYYCVGLTSVTIGNSVTSIGSDAFSCCSGLTSVTIPESVTLIGSDAFFRCSGLTSVTIGNSTINNSFSSCTKLKQVICSDTTPAKLAEDPFPYTDTIFVPANAVDSYKTAPIWKRKEILPFGIISVKSNNEMQGTIVQKDSIIIDGKPQTIAATANEGYHFVKWSDGNTDNPRIYSTAKDTSFTAIFEAHTVVVDSAVAATCAKSGKTEGSHCSVCNEVLVAQETIATLSHTEVVDAAVAATCTKTGLTEGKHCSVCNAVIVEQTEIPMVEHTIVTDAAVAATATETGLTEGSHCSVCGAIIVAQEVIPALGEQGNENQGGENTNPGTAIAESAADNLQVYAHHNTIIVENATEEIRVYNAMGALVGRDVACRVRAEINVNGAGVYIVKVGTVAKRVMIND